MSINHEMVQQKQIADVQVFTIQGILKYENSKDLKDSILGFYNQEANGFIFDLSTVTAIDSTGMGALLSFLKKTDGTQPICLVVPDSFLRELFSIAKFEQIFSIFETMEQAMQFIHGEGNN
ncbi:STAS domain-containing protein [Bacillus alkalicellulosilyticus]|uniref:STAS domain-containing protein n=1 Tax=Alkalihalobacterium alkalicellulosilyticum TaxID=1912214 RepID=UPI000997E96E|nr:STAS domain-containing protein [Bacillus alkalicellulosilyticus]